MIYIVETSDERLGKFTSLTVAKHACISHFDKTHWHYYIIKVYNPKLNRVSKTHFSRCDSYHDYFCNCDLSYICLDYGRNKKHYVK